ncbi:hypothetical protein BH24GEM3_BH24GEM3_14930 [soil metagenome]
MAFWDTEDELERKVREWIYACRESVARRVFNHELAAIGYQPKLGKPSFVFDPKQRYIGPKTKRLSKTRAPMLALGAGAVAVSVVALLILALTA